MPGEKSDRPRADVNVIRTVESLTQAFIGELDKIAEGEFKWAAAPPDTRCLRKFVGCTVVDPCMNHRICYAKNGPTHIQQRNKTQCTNEVGNCGCAHAEPKALLEAVYNMTAAGTPDLNKLGLVMVCLYSPCTSCANVIVSADQFIGGVVYRNFTEHDPRGVTILERAGVDILTFEHLKKHQQALLPTPVQENVNDILSRWIKTGRAGRGTT